MLHVEKQAVVKNMNTRSWHCEKVFFTLTVYSNAFFSANRFAGENFSQSIHREKFNYMQRLGPRRSSLTLLTSFYHLHAFPV